MFNKLFTALTVTLVATSYASPAGILGGLLQGRSASISSGCGTSGPASCTNTTVISNLCCFEYPGGLILLTQFWDFNPSTGPSDSWTIHGLWPDHCDGTFSQNCDPSRDYTNISGLLTSQGAGSTLSFMQTYWDNINGNNEQLWEHEWATHGTCYSTLNPSCLPTGSPTGAEAVAFFETVVGLFQQYNIYSALAAANITPSSSAKYTLSSLDNAIVTAYGVTPAFFCTSGSLNQVYIYFHLKGSVIDGEFLPINAPSAGNCPSSGISYPPKT
ncbi:ribonuclease T2-like protein [Amanita rubescens]|nr:ribonuclease T2-like protein [Amanita rubescens]